MSVSFPPHSKIDLTIEFSRSDHTKLPIKICKTETDAVVYGLAIKYIGSVGIEGDKFEVALLNAQNSSNILTMNTSAVGIQCLRVDVDRGLIRITTLGANTSSTVFYNPINSHELPSSEVRFRVPNEIVQLVQKARAGNYPRKLPVVKLLAGRNVVVIFCSDCSSNYAIYVARKTDREFFECDFERLNGSTANSEWLVQFPNESGCHNLVIGMIGSSTWDNEPIDEQTL